MTNSGGITLRIVPSYLDIYPNMIIPSITSIPTRDMRVVLTLRFSRVVPQSPYETS